MTSWNGCSSVSHRYATLLLITQNRQRGEGGAEQFGWQAEVSFGIVISEPFWLICGDIPHPQAMTCVSYVGPGRNSSFVSNGWGGQCHHWMPCHSPSDVQHPPSWHFRVPEIFHRFLPAPFPLLLFQSCSQVYISYHQALDQIFKKIPDAIAI